VVWDSLLIRWLGREWGRIGQVLWNLCDYFVPVWPYL
jgi:hypothetical protein